jgi:hypothetical protein
MAGAEMWRILILVFAVVSIVSRAGANRSSQSMGVRHRTDGLRRRRHHWSDRRGERRVGGDALDCDRGSRMVVRPRRRCNRLGADLSAPVNVVAKRPVTLFFGAGFGSYRAQAPMNQLC